MSKVQQWMNAFQKGYREKNLMTRVDFINETMILDDATVFMGYDLNEWSSSMDEIASLLEVQWQMDFDFNFKEATVQERDGFVFIYSTATMTTNGNPIEALKVKLSPMMDRLEEPLVLDEVVRQIAHTIDDYSKVSSPVRFTAILKEIDGVLKGHQLQFSLDAVMLWQYRYMSSNELKPYFDMADREYDPEIKTLLSKFQKGYDERNLDQLDDFMALFIDDPDMISIGTDADEFLVGPGDLKEVIESDWTYWGDFKLNIEGALVVTCGDQAYFVTKAMLEKHHNQDAMIEGIKHYLTNEVLAAEDRDSMINGFRYLVDLRTEMNKGEAYFAPMRFSGYCVKDEGQWKFAHIQYSDYMKTPEKFNV